jgi:hypothetical protein
MRPAYVRVDLGDQDDKELPSFAISPVPFLYHQGELLMPAEAKIYEAESYSALCAILRDEFQIPDAILPPAKYFKPTKAEREEREVEESHIYRTVPEGTGEPEWRTKAR